MADELEFQPKAGGETWVAYIGEADFSGYDIVLMLDKKKCTDKSGWMLELAVDADGTVAGQITSRPGYDALAQFASSQKEFEVFSNFGSPNFKFREDGKWKMTNVGTIGDKD
jgi:hypothetical protein